ncbi:YfcE family phosphodiesterase [Bacillus sp. AFS073361]|uniref:metallophosphoesterase family protein n=1 Tax=Bacillus sp. AFS073361 TaxID=2033511 RepID=UPI000BF8EB31|nr:YfcE family phosphodiesterase [Bacillus sp. AFS073361]PFP29508.1 YfcE family phosphodiesterase [Bacillus sp. AFS073361]
MRIAFISDIHGNATALDRVLADINQRNVKKIFVLGDLCFRGPEPQRSLDLVRSLNTEVIKGNADEWVVRGIKEGEVPDSALEMMSKERDWTLSQIEKTSIDYLRNLPTELKLEFGKIKINAYHATPNSLFEVVNPNESDQVIAEKMMDSEADIYIYAHIHKPYIRYINGKCIINIGSVGLPFDGLAKSSYAILEIHEESFRTSIVRVNYDVNKVINQFTESDYPNIEQMKKMLRNAGI